jgi:hypothetical protein
MPASRDARTTRSLRDFNGVPTRDRRRTTPDVASSAAIAGTWTAPRQARDGDREIERIETAWCTTYAPVEDGPASCDQICFDAGGIVGQLSTFAPGAQDDRESMAVTRTGSKLAMTCM